MGQIDNEPSDAQVMESLYAVRAILDRHGFPSAMHNHSGGARSLIVYPILEPVPGVASNNDGYQDNINRLDGVDVGFWFSYHDSRNQVFKVWTHNGGMAPTTEATTAEECAAFVISKLVAAGDNKIEIIDEKPTKERGCISWQYPTGTGTERFAVYNEGTKKITLYGPEGNTLSCYHHPEHSAFNHVMARRIARQLWGKPAYEQHRVTPYE